MGIKHKEDVSANGLHNTLSAATTVKGDIMTDADFRLDGKVDGNVTCKGKIVLGPKGRVTGNIITTNAEILGEVDGTIQVNGKLVLKSSAIIKGDITTKTLEIEPNARFNGSCMMTDDKQMTALPEAR